MQQSELVLTPKPTERTLLREVRIAVDHQLVRSGPYRMLRHPIYTAMLGMFLGTAIAVSQYHALIGLALSASNLSSMAFTIWPCWTKCLRKKTFRR